MTNELWARAAAMQPEAIEYVERQLAAIEKRQQDLHAQIARLVKERDEAVKSRVALLNALYEAEFALDGHEDIVDGPEGQQLPNAAMKALTAIRKVLP